MPVAHSELQVADVPMSPIDLVAVTCMKRNDFDQLLHRMGRSGEIEKLKRGKHVHSDHSGLKELHPS